MKTEIRPQQKLLPEKKVRERYGVVPMTLRRWDQDERLGFPKPIYIRKRRYRDEAELDAFDERMKANGASTKGE
jgi:hypothetical protein